jgi:hypothetical protein
MPNDRSERRSYRKSPGRQYGYEYDPLRSRSTASQSGRADNAQSERWQTHSEPSRSAALAQRPDPRRTRQLLRQNIIASKAHAADDDVEQLEQHEQERHAPRMPAHEGSDSVPLSRSRNYSPPPTRSSHVAQPHLPSTRELMDEGEEEDEWADFEDVDPDIGYEEPFEGQQEYVAGPPARSAQLPPVPYPRAGAATRVPERSRRLARPQDEEDEDDYYEEDEPPTRRRRKKRKVSRRKLLVGLGLVAVGGGAAAAYEFGPKVPQALGNVGSNIEHQLQDAFNKGVTQGAEQVRKEFITSLEDLEGFTLQGAITAARLTRVAYDVFVSPIIQAGATITGDFLSVMLQALKVGRSWLARVYQDNSTLAAIQKVLETWVAQVSNMPKQLNAITETDLDGAQAYLRALQRKIDDEKAKLNGPQPTPTAKPAPKPTPKSS